ncbi:MAG: SCP-like extracellular, partial [Frankiales bacterium]|nr:SCP-like extracellular [Frankiales bacterium]
RRSGGLQPLRLDPRLQQVARAWAERMAATGTLSHDDPLFSRASHDRLGMRLLAENVGFDISVKAQHQAFLASPHHRANLEIPSLRFAGVAVVRDRAGHLWSVEDFGSPRI